MRGTDSWPRTSSGSRRNHPPPLVLLVVLPLELLEPAVGG